jgi:hypothetical protein
MLDIPAEATWTPAGRSDSERAVARRIEKLLALGQSGDEHEAEAAVAKAQKLALKYNIEQLQSGVDSDYSLRVIGPAKSRMPSYFWGIMRILCDFHFVTYICRTHNVLEDYEWTRRSVIELYGTAQNLDMAEYVFYFLWHQGELHWSQYKAEHKLRSNKHKLSYLNGLYVGVWERLDKQRQDVAENEALVWRDDPKLEAFFRERNPRVRTTRRSSRLYEAAHSAGNAAGSKLQILSDLLNKSATCTYYIGNERFTETCLGAGRCPCSRHRLHAARRPRTGGPWQGSRTGRDPLPGVRACREQKAYVSRLSADRRR